MKTIFRALCAGLCWITLITQYILLVQGGEYGGLGASTLAYFGFFTILTNILAALAFTAPFLSETNRIRRFFTIQEVRAAIALYILVVMVVYYALLAEIHNPVGLNAITNIGLHFLIPVLYIFDWLVFADKDRLSYRTLPWWVAYPVAYGLFNIVRGMATGFYPYPFINVTELGWMSVFLNMIGFTLVYLVGGALFITLGRALSAKFAGRASG